MDPVDVKLGKFAEKGALCALLFGASHYGSGIAVGRPLTTSAISCPLPAAMVQPSVPWPVLRYSDLIADCPRYGTFDGVNGRNPAQ